MYVKCSVVGDIYECVTAKSACTVPQLDIKV